MEILDVRYVAEPYIKFKAVSIPRSTTNLLSLLKVCSERSAEATPLFYKENQFRLQSSTADYSSAHHFIDLLSPTTCKCITSFGVTGLQPCEKSKYGCYGVYQHCHELNGKCRYYYLSEEAFFAKRLPQLAPKELSLGFDLSHIANNPENSNRKEYSPRASWLNKFLRLPLERINLELALWSPLAGSGRFSH